MKSLFKTLTVLLLVSCTGHGQFDYTPSMEHACWLDVQDSLVVSISPYDGSRDTLYINNVYERVVCMSSTFVAGFAEIGAVDAVAGVSGLRYISNQDVHAAEVGSDAALDYEAVLELQPDVVLTYGVAAAKPEYEQRLNELGVRTFRLYDHLETSPLGRSEYLKAYGAMTGRRAQADSLYKVICESYESLTVRTDTPVKVLINAPFGDAWYIPCEDSYFSHLVKDAGGVILGSQPGVGSAVISRETAFVLSQQADLWLNPGRGQRPDFIPRMPTYDNTLRTTPEGGNDFWERGAIRCDLVLRDLVSVFAGRTENLEYYLEVK